MTSLYNLGVDILFEKFMQLFNLEDDEEFNFSNDGRKYRIHNDELQTVYSELEDSGWFTVKEDTKYHLISKAILGEIQILWKPKKWNKYYKVVYCKDNLDIIKETWGDNCGNFSDYISGNCFRTAEEIDKREVYKKLLDKYNNL